MIDILQLAFKYLRFHWIKTGILIVAIALIVFLPFGLDLLVRHGSKSLLARAETTPLVVGQKASPLELVLSTLYFDTAPPPEIAFAEVARINETGLATAIPVYNRFRARGFPIVGTNLDYFSFRNLHLAEGRHPLLIGECVLGADAADALEISVGDYVISTPEELFDFAGTYPLKMEVVGILAGSGTPDDRIILTDIKTSWIIAGIAHGHEDVTQSTKDDTILRREGTRIVTNASIVTYNVINQSNRASYHFHGEMADFPLTSVIALPDDPRAKALLQGKYLGTGETMQMIVPSRIIESLLGTMFRLREYLLLGSALAVISTLSTAALVFFLSLRLRKREIETMHRIGLPRTRVVGLLATEIAIVIAAAVILATLLSLIFSQYVDYIMLKILT
jgi:putative ABC transport system permease protein